MPSYTITASFLENVENKNHICDILFAFTQTNNPYKVTVDKGKKIIDLYSKIGANKEVIAHWLQLMSYQPSSFEEVNIIIPNCSCRDEIFLILCKEAKSGKNIIVYSHEEWEIDVEYLPNQIILYKGVKIQAFDKDEACVLFNPKSHSITVSNSQITGNIMENNDIKDSIIANNGGKIEGTANEGSIVASNSGKIENVGNKTYNQGKKEGVFIGLVLGVISSLIANYIWVYFTNK